MLKIASVIFLILFPTLLYAQAPQKMSYQAVIRNQNNSLISLTPIGMRISVLQGASAGKPVYSERQNGTTNTNGLVSIQIGTGQILEGIFESIDWENGPYYIKIETDPTGGTNYSIIGISELLSVPYALFALKVGAGSQGIDGEAGEKGEVGEKGETGETGNKGESGDKGSVGNKGLTGDQGSVGTKGVTGDQGIVGNQGAVGVTGDKGIVGDQGVLGNKGVTGDQGSVGTKGAAGDQGIVGNQGAVGVTGDKGIVGDQGVLGNKGL
ncbi:MAG: collagen-like protein, partial [Prolixibacteraceae bacterium]